MFHKRRERPSLNRAGKMPSGWTVGVFLFLLIGLSAFSANETRAGLADHAVVNEVSLEGAGGSGGVYDDWVELYNPTAQTIDLTGWSIQKTAYSGGSLKNVPLNGSLPANGYFLIVRNSATTTQSLKDSADILADDALFSLASSNIIYLVNDNNNIASTTNPNDPNIVDFVGLGSAVVYEGSAAAPNPSAGKSVARIPAGEETNQNSVDFVAQDSPTPTNSQASGGNDIGGTVLLTITPDAAPAQNIGSKEAQIVFQVNATGSALVKYGLDTTYASSTAAEAVALNVTKAISLSGLACATTYHYLIYAENADASQTATTSDAVFTTLPCGIALDSLVITKASAKANNQFIDGWQWEFNLTVWDMNEISLKMKFNQWSGAGVLEAAANMQYSADNGSVWHEITANAVYPAVGADLNGIDNDAAAGRQVKVIVRMKVPVGTAAGFYNSSYGILTE